MSMQSVDKNGLRRKADREVLYLLGGFLVFWALVGWVGFSLYSVFQCYQIIGDVKAACTKALSIGMLPDDLRSELRGILIDVHISKSEREEALKVIAEQEIAGHATGELVSKKAQLLVDQGKTDEAAATYRKALELEPTNDTYATSLLRMELDAGQLDAARSDAVRFLETTPNSASVLSWAGWIEHRDGNYEKAVEFYERAISNNSSDGWLHYDLGVIHASADDAPKALFSYSNAINLDTTNTTFLTKRAALHNDMGEHGLAQKDYVAAMEQSRDVDTLIGLGRSYTDSRDFEKAAPLFDEAITQNDTYDWAHDSKIRLLYRQEKFAEARSAVGALRGKVPDSVYATYWTATLDDEEGKDQEALKGYLKTSEIWTTDGGLQSDIGHLLIDLGRTEAALMRFEKAVELSPNSVISYNSRARAYLYLSRWSEAISDANTALKLDPSNGVAYSRRANAEWGLKQTEAAKADYARAVVLSAHTKWLRAEQIDFLIDSKLFDDAEASIRAFEAIDQAAAAEWKSKLDNTRSNQK